MLFDRKTILVTGGTGSFGRKFVKMIFEQFNPKKVIVFSRDELKQSDMSHEYNNPCLAFFLGDVRDAGRLHRAFDGVDYVVHAAALKQVPSCEYNPFEAITTNILGAKNVIDAAIDLGVKKVIALSSDKAVNPINLYGATKLCSDKLFISGNSYTGAKETKFSVVRYGNVIGSRGSVIPLFQKLKESGKIPITDMRMTRFWLTLQQGVDFVFNCFELMRGGEIFVPKIPSMRIVDLAKAIAPECEIDIVGIRPGEKLHEVLISEDDAMNVREFNDFFVIEPAFHWWRENGSNGKGKEVKDGFSYTSYNNTPWLTPREMEGML